MIVLISATLGLFWAPAMAMLADAATGIGLDQGLSATLMNISWALGQILGSVGGGAGAKPAGEAAPMWVAATLCVLTLVGIGRRTVWSAAVTDRSSGAGGT